MKPLRAFIAFIKPLFTDIFKYILDTLFPIICIVCKTTEGKFICSVCKSLLKKIEHQHCIVCQKQSIMGITHPGCKTPHTPDGLITVFNYHDPNVARIIIEGKYHFLQGVYYELSSTLAEKIASHYPQLISEFAITFIPLTPSRKRWRGFNQADILCQGISEILNIPISHTLIRTKFNKAQKDLKKKARPQNVEGAFAFFQNKKTPNPNSDNTSVDKTNKNFILVDDVVTTGSTLLEATKVLKQSGAKQVWCLAIARD